MRWFWIALGFLCCFNTLLCCKFCAVEPAAPKWVDGFEIIDSESSNIIDMSQLVSRLIAYDAIFFGEFHGNKNLHQAEIELLDTMHERNRKIAISLEMFERDVQPILDSYLAGEIDEAKFLETSRPWSNYDPDYKPLIEFAKEHGLPVVAANVPRRLAAMVSRGGKEAFESFTDEEKPFASRTLHTPEDEYKKCFLATMSGGMHPMGKLNLDYLYMAQCLKDDTMAESIADFVDSHPGSIVIHYNGDFHSNSGLGTVERLKMRKPDMKIAVISPATKPLTDDDKKMGDYLILLEQEETQE